MASYTLRGRVRDSAGHESSSDVVVTVEGSVRPSWGPAILAWIQPMPESLGRIIYATPADWRTKAGLLLPGERLYLEPGEYGARGQTFGFARPGVSTAPITISGIPGEERPVILGKISMYGPWQRWSRSIFDGPTGNVGGPGPNGEANFVNLDGPQLELSDCEVRHCYWHAGISGSDASYYRVLRCYIHDNGGLNGDYRTSDSQWNTSHGAYLSPSSYGLMANCLVEHNDAKGVMGRHDSHHLLLVHNTIVANGRHGIAAGEQSHDWVMANNILLNNGNVKDGVSIDNDGVGPYLIKRNVVWNGGNRGNEHFTVTGKDIETLVADPKLVRPAVYSDHQDLAPNWDHRLRSDSPAIGYGDPAYAMPDDFFGNPRSGAPDAGACQFMNAT